MAAVTKMSAELSDLAISNREQLLEYGGDYSDAGEPDQCRLLDLVLLTECVVFSLLTYDVVCDQPEYTEAPESISLTSDLLLKFDKLIVTEKTQADNQQLANCMLTRGVMGAYESVQELVGAALVAYPDEERATNLLCQLAERLFLKALTSPLNVHVTFSNQVLLHLLTSTESTYHRSLSKSIIKMMDALYKELKKGGQEAFKKKILFKINYAIALIMSNSDTDTCIEMLRTQSNIIKEGNHEMSYLLFNAVDGRHIREQIQQDSTPEEFSKFQEEATSVVQIVMTKLEKFIEDHKEKIEKATSLKTLVLLLKPLEECMNMAGDHEAWFDRLSAVLKAMSPIFPMAKSPKINVPNSLLESFISLTLQADREYQKTNKLSFEKYFMLFSVVQNQLKKQPQQAISMAKIIQLNTATTVPAEDKQHFYKQFGAVVKQLLSNKEFNTFFTVLNAFMDWAKTTDLEDLNFMVPEDPTVQQLLQNFMQQNKIDIVANNNGTNIQQKMIDLQRKLMDNTMQDLEIMEQFCLPAKEMPLVGDVPTSVPKKDRAPKASMYTEAESDQSDEATSETPGKPEPPELAQKLVEVQFMMSGKPVPQDVKSVVRDLYAKFKSQEWPEGGTDQELMKYIQTQTF